jgi:hypothetical protein
LNYPERDGAAAKAQVEFLLFGDDAQHAPQLLAAIDQGWNAAERAAADSRSRRGDPGDPQLPENDSAFDRLIADRRAEFTVWERDPLVGQPVFEPTAGLSTDLLAAEREMLVLLKLQRRLTQATAIAPQASSRKTRVVEFSRAAGAKVVGPLSSPVLAPPATIGDLYARLTDAGAPAWATLDVDGRLLLSTDRRRMDELFQLRAERYTVLHDGDRVGLRCRLESGQTLEGWLVANPDNAARPLAKFAMIPPRASQIRIAVMDERTQTQSTSTGTPARNFNEKSSSAHP